MTKKIFTEDDIISFVDGTFDKTKTNEIKKFINKNNEAKKIYLFYKSFSNFDGDLSSVKDKEVPNHLKNYVTEETSRIIKKQKENSVSFTDLINNFLFTLKSNYAVAAMSLLIGVFGTRFYYDQGDYTFNQNNLQFRSGQITNVDYNKYFQLQIKNLTSGKSVLFGEKIGINNEFIIYIKAKKKGEIKVNFYEDNLIYSFSAKKNQTLEIPKLIATPEYITFSVDFTYDQEKISEEFFFVVKD